MCELYQATPLSSEEHVELVKRIVRVANLYGLNVNPHVAAWLGLGSVAVAVVGPRMIEVAERRQAAQGANSGPVESKKAKGDVEASPAA